MKTSTKLFIAAAILILIRITSLGLLCFIAGLILLIVQGVSEINNKNKTPSDKGYAEAWKAYEDVTKKRKQGTKPPWEE